MSRIPVITSPDNSGALYEVKSGDTLYGLVIASGTMSLLEPQPAIELVMQDNPHIRNADMIHPGDLIFIRNRDAVGRPLSSVTQKDIVATHRELPSVTKLSGSVGSGINWPNMAATVSFGASEAAASQLSVLRTQNAQSIQEIINSYRKMKAGDISKSAHYSARTAHISSISRSLGPLEKGMLGGSANSQLRMAYGPGKGIDRTAPMRSQATRLKNTARNLSRGGAALGVASVAVDAGFTHYAVCTADDAVQKNEAFFGGIGGTLGGLGGGSLGGAAAGTAITAGFIFFIGSNPAGWVVGLAIVGGSAVGAGLGSWGGSTAATKLYDEVGNGYDVVDAIPIDGGCSIWQ